MTDARLRIAFPPSPEREIGNIDEGPHDGTKRLRKRGHLEPLVQGTALVRLELTETDPPDRCGVNEPLHGFPYHREHALHPGMEEQRLFVFDEEMRVSGLRVMRPEEAGSPPGREIPLPVFPVAYFGGTGVGTMLRTGGRDMR